MPVVAQFTLDLGKIYDTMTEYAGEMKAGTMSKDSQESLAKTRGFSPCQPQKYAHVVPDCRVLAPCVQISLFVFVSSALGLTWPMDLCIIYIQTKDA